MREFTSQFRASFLSAAFFSLIINMLMLAPALFMLQVFDRVVSSRSGETLVMLFVLTLLALFFMAYLDINALRAFLTGPGIIAMFDAPWVPLFIVVIFLFHPMLGVVALLGALLLLGLAVLNEKLSRRSLEAMQTDARLAGRFVDQSLGNAEVVGALGMVDNVTQDWREMSQK